MAAPEMFMCVSVCVCVCVRCVHVCMTVGSSCGSTDNTSVHSSITYHLQLGNQWKPVETSVLLHGEGMSLGLWAWAVLG